MSREHLINVRSGLSYRLGRSEAQLRPTGGVTAGHSWVYLSLLVLTCVVFFEGAETLAITPAPDGGYVNGNTAEGTNALHDLTTGKYNTAAGLSALFSDT